MGEKVKRFDIVKAIGRENPLLSSVLDLVAQEQTRKHDKFYKKKNNSFTRVLQNLQTVISATDNNLKVDRMWERLVEIALFNRTQSHRQPGQVLKAFIKTDDKTDTTKLTPAELASLRSTFAFLDKCYKETKLGSTRLARDLPHFYTMVTTLLSSNLLDADGAPPKYPTVRKKLLAFAKLLPEDAKLPSNQSIFDALEEYKEAAARQTTHPGRRRTRQEKLLEILEEL